MISIRSILLVLFVWGVLWLGQRWYQKRLNNRKTNTPTPSQATTQQPGMMVPCDYCGLYLPEEETFRLGKTYYCCEAHKQAAQRL